MHSPVVLGLDFGGTKIAGAVCDLTGLRLGSMTIDTRASDGAQTSLERGLLAARSLLDSSARGRPLAAVGACTIGIPNENGISLAPAIPGCGEPCVKLRGPHPKPKGLTCRRSSGDSLHCEAPSVP